MQDNIKHLKTLLAQYKAAGVDTTEGVEFLDAIEDDYADLVEAHKECEKELENEMRQLQDEVDEEETTEVFLGLDTLHYRLEQGNLKVQLQLEHFINQVKNQNGAGVLMPG